jgi:hypothetical protein
VGVSVVELQRIAAVKDPLGMPWGADLLTRLNGETARGTVKRIVPMSGLVSANIQVTPALVESVLDSVRTRVLNLALELELLIPDAGEPGVTSDDPGRVNYIVTAHIYG